MPDVKYKPGFNYKKTLHASERDRGKNKGKRESYIKEQKGLSAEQQVFLDESGSNTGMPSNRRFARYGRAVEKKRVYDSAPINQTAIISSIRLCGSTVPVTLSGAMNGEQFKHYITTNLAPALHKDDIVIMDNLSSHKVAGIKEAVEKAGATVMYIPPYSPDLHPIKEMWSQLKAYLRKAKARTNGDLLAAIVAGFKTSTPDNCLGWFTLAGYI
jgi:transposase